MLVCLYCLWSCLSHAQKTAFPFQWVEMPLEVKEILKEQYENKNCGAENNVYNIGVRDDVEPQNGVYWYHGMGPHFPHKVFVYYNKERYVLKGDVEYSQDSIIQDFSKCVKSLRISKKDSTAYFNAIINTLAGKDIKMTPKKKLCKKDVSQKILEGQWFLQMCRKQTGKKVEWDRCGGQTHVTIVDTDGLYRLFFIDDTPVTIDRLSFKKAFIYNDKLFVYLSKKNSFRSKVSFLISSAPLGQSTSESVNHHSSYQK